VQAANSGGNDAAAKSAAQAEITALKAEIDRISDNTRFGGVSLLDGTYGSTAANTVGYDADNAVTWTAGDDFTININGTGAVTVDLAGTGGTGAQAATAIQTAIRASLAAGTAAQQAFAQKVNVTSETVGAGVNLKVEISGLSNGETFVLADGTGTPLAAMGFGAVTAASGTGGVFQIGANSNETVQLAITDTDSTALGLGAVDVTTDAGAAAAIAAIDTAISEVSTQRGNLGALQNRFESMINNLQVTTENLNASESRIRDTDMAQEMVSFTKNNVLMQAGTAMLAQANQVPQSILSLLR
jgi:flagellin